MNNIENDHFASLCSMVDLLRDELPSDICNRRDICSNCERPSVVCLCSYFPQNLIISKRIKIWIFQHPKEETRCLRTTRILEKCLNEKNFEIIKSRRFTAENFPQLEKVYRSRNTVVLYPSPTSISLDQYRTMLDSQDKSDEENDENLFHVIIIDGTWAQASGIYFTNTILQSLKQIRIDADFVSEYRIRTQPRECFLSTLETCSIILATLEKNPQIHEQLVRPLKALCDYQIDYGAQPHQSKEWLLLNNKYTKPVSKRNYNKLTRDSKLSVQKIQSDDLELKQ